MRVALFQGPTAPGLDDALSEVRTAASAAAESGASILVCSELTVSGFRTPLTPERRPDSAARGLIGTTIARTAADYGIAIAYGYAELGDPGAIYNSVAVAGADGGLLAHYRKTHLFRPPAGEQPEPPMGAPDDAPFTPGDDLVVQFALDGLTCGLLICYDVEFPEVVRAHALAGTDCLLVPTALAYPDDRVATTLVPARAMESQLFIAYVNRVGTEVGPDGGAPIRYCGRSCAIAPDGTELARAAENSELLLVDFDPALIAQSRCRTPYFVDRRVDLYERDGGTA